ncbi:alpha/beta hydrolase [Thiohalorhabdus sp.]|uniref:alpha/beta hydrolase n=1 Tax=Thiohalorhabdus sp. TaxID=3094134 RepID=UPI002FC3CF17
MAGNDRGTPLECRDLAPSGPAQGAIVWLHGLGADGHDFEPLFRETAALPPETRVLLPHAPRQPVTINGGMRMRAWYDISSPELTADADLEGINRSAGRMIALLEGLEAEGIEPSRTVLGGFSQGGVLALWAGLAYPRPLAGIAALSAYLPADPPVTEAQRHTPLFLGHGQYDSLIPPTLGEAARDRLSALGTQPPEWHAYPMDHGISETEMVDLFAWLDRVLG